MTEQEPTGTAGAHGIGGVFPEPVDEIEVQPYGRFVHIQDNDGRRVELWEPIDEVYRDTAEGITPS